MLLIYVGCESSSSFLTYRYVCACGCVHVYRCVSVCRYYCEDDGNKSENINKINETLLFVNQKLISYKDVFQVVFMFSIC